MANIIKQIKTPNGQSYDIHAITADNATNADALGGKSLAQIEQMVNGAIDTYVIPSQTGASSNSPYAKVVESDLPQVSTTISDLNTLTGSLNTNTFKVGDVILMGATSDGTNNFDRWVSNISGTTITLDILETQTATHHHTFAPVIATSSKALTGVSTIASVKVAKVGTSVTVTNDKGTYLTDVAYSTDDSDKGGYDIDLVTATSTDTDAVAHSHSVNSHSHSITFNPTTTLVSRTVSAYTALSTTTFTPHEHSSASVAGAASDSSAITFVTGGTTGTFVTAISDSTANSTTGGSGELTTSANTAATSTSAQKSTDAVGSDILTVSSGSHTHSVTLTTADSAVVTAATVAASVVTSVSYSFTKPSVAPTVVTGVTYASKTAVGSASLTGTTTFVEACSVDTNGVLSFTTASIGISTSPITVASITSVATTTQTSGSLTISAPRSSQSRTLGKLTVSGSTESAGSHEHGFSHTHTIPTHTHKIATHTHTYKKQYASGHSDAYITLGSSSFTPHTHALNVSVATPATDSTPITYVSGGTQTKVIQDLKNAALSGVSTSGATASTGNAYLKTTAAITFPGLKLTKNALSTTSITPAATGETVVTGITFTSGNFVTGISGGKTSDNIPGSGK